jgi:hypothetical protein
VACLRGRLNKEGSDWEPNIQLCIFTRIKMRVKVKRSVAPTIILQLGHGVKPPGGFRGACNSPCHFDETTGTKGNRAAVV